MLDGLADEEVDHFLEDHPRIVPLFDIDIVTTVGPYEPTKEERDIDREPDPKNRSKNYDMHAKCSNVSLPSLNM